MQRGEAHLPGVWGCPPDSEFPLLGWGSVGWKGQKEFSNTLLDQICLANGLTPLEAMGTLSVYTLYLVRQGQNAR